MTSQVFQLPELSRRYCLVALITLLVAACGSSGPSSLTDPNVELRTEPEYVLVPLASGHELLIEFALDNASRDRVYIPSNCLGDYALHIERLIDGRWESAVPFYGRVMADCGVGNRIDLGAGNVLQGELSLLSLTDVRPEEIHGSYRLVLPDLVDHSGRSIGPIRSEPFSVRSP
jgi:hypothetical protein